jgi:flagellar motility protein MotE (MotC chaperone)
MSFRNENRITRIAMALAGSIALICLCIGASQPLFDRVLSGGTLFASSAGAEEAAPGSHLPPASEVAIEKGEPATQSPSARSEIFQNDPVASLTEAIQRKQQELSAKETEIDQEKSKLELLRTDIEQKIAELESQRQKLTLDREEFLAQVEARQRKDTKKWVEIYQGMPPQVAAQVLEAVENQDAIDLLSQMDVKKAGKILDAMKREKAIALFEGGLKLGRVE